ncbi:hypothetical protein D9M69_630750 [compost metagenome]
MAHHVQEGPVAREQDQFFGGVGAYRFLGLPMQVGPVMPARSIAGRHDAARRALRHGLAVAQYLDAQFAGRFRHQPLQP